MFALSPHYRPGTTALALAIKNRKPEIVRKLLAQEEINVEFHDPVIEIIETFGEDHFDLVETVVFKASEHYIRSEMVEYPRVHIRDVALRLGLTKVVDLIDNKVGKKKGDVPSVLKFFIEDIS